MTRWMMLCILLLPLFPGLAMSSHDHSSIYFVSENVCVSRADVSIKNGKVDFDIIKNVICSDRPITLLSVQDNKVVLSNDKGESVVYDRFAHKKIDTHKGVGSYFSPDGSRYYYVLGMYGSGIFKESSDGVTEKILDKNIYNPQKIVPIGNQSYILGDEDKLWVSSFKKDGVIEISSECKFIGRGRSDNIICFDRKERNVNILTEEGGVETTLQVNDATFPVAYLPNLNMLLAVRGKLGDRNRQDYEPVLIDIEKSNAGKVFSSGLSLALTNRQVAVVN